MGEVIKRNFANRQEEDFPVQIETGPGPYDHLSDEQLKALIAETEESNEEGE